MWKLKDTEVYFHTFSLPFIYFRTFLDPFWTLSNVLTYSFKNSEISFYQIICKKVKIKNMKNFLFLSFCHKWKNFSAYISWPEFYTFIARISNKKLHPSLVWTFMTWKIEAKVFFRLCTHRHKFVASFFRIKKNYSWQATLYCLLGRKKGNLGFGKRCWYAATTQLHQFIWIFPAYLWPLPAKDQQKK